MAKHFTTVRLTTEDDPAKYGVGKPSKMEGLMALLNLLSDVMSGTKNGKVEVSAPGNTAHAMSTVTAGTVNGTVVLGGVSVNGSGASAAARAADAVANLLASTDATILALLGKVVYVAGASTFEVWAKDAGVAGNSVTLTVTGTGWSATGSGKLAGAADANFRSYASGM